MVDDGTGEHGTWEHRTGERRPTRRLGVASMAAVGAWIVVVAVAMIWSPPVRSGVHAPPFFGRWDFHDLTGLLPAVLVAAVLVRTWPTLVDRVSGARLAATAGLASVAWAVLLAVSGGVDRLWTPLESKHLYFGVGAELDAATFVRTFVDRLDRYPIHVKGHPPGAPLLLRALDAIGLGGPRWAAVVVVAVWGLGIAAVVATVSLLSGADAARRVSAPVAFLPGVVFAATTFDAMFAGLMAMAIALLVYASGTRSWTADVAALAGGVLIGVGLHLSYGLAPLGLIPFVMVVRSRRLRPVVIAGVGAAAVFVAFVAAGFWWLDGLNATRGFYTEGVSQYRPYGYFVFFGNPAALALCVGPFVGVGLVTSARSAALRTSSPMLLAGAAFVAAVAANLTGLSNAETERIWLPFMPWLAVAAGAATWPTRGSRVVLGVSLALGLVIQATLVTPW